MAKGTTWFKAKRDKLRKQEMTARFGGYERRSENADLRDRRDGGEAPHGRKPEQYGPYWQNSDCQKATLLPGKASGLSRDIANYRRHCGKVTGRMTKKEKEHYSLRNLNGIVKSCFSTSKKWEIVKK